MVGLAVDRLIATADENPGHSYCNACGGILRFDDVSPLHGDVQCAQCWTILDFSDFLNNFYLINDTFCFSCGSELVFNEYQCTDCNTVYSDEMWAEMFAFIYRLGVYNDPSTSSMEIFLQRMNGTKNYRKDYDRKIHELKNTCLLCCKPKSECFCGRTVLPSDVFLSDSVKFADVYDDISAYFATNEFLDLPHDKQDTLASKTTCLNCENMFTVDCPKLVELTAKAQISIGSRDELIVKMPYKLIDCEYFSPWEYLLN